MIKFLFLYLIVSCWGWGKIGHKLINEYAIYSLPEPLKNFFSKHKRIIIEESITPDYWKNSNGLEENRHFIDIDRYGSHPFTDFPQKYEDAVKIFGEEKLFENGILPWRIEEYVKILTDAFRKKRWDSIIYNAAILGHYVGDLHQPLHLTENYDGQLSGNTGVHYRYEETMFNYFWREFRINPKKATQLKNVNEEIFKWIRMIYPLHKKILKADSIAKDFAGTIDEEYYEVLFEKLKSQTQLCIQEAATNLGSLWLTAYIDAGSPALPK